MIAAIVAVNNNWGIGYNGDLLEHIPADLKNFRKLTENNIVVMGRKTWDSLPKKPLPNRSNIIITNTIKKESEIFDENANYIQFVSCDSIEKFKIDTHNDVFVIGGETIYKQFLPICDKVFVTKIFKDHENIDTYFPNLDEMNDWKGFAIDEIQEYNDLAYQFWEYNRI